MSVILGVILIIAGLNNDPINWFQVVMGLLVWLWTD